MSECQQCKTASARRHWGGYDFACAHCCARLLVSARGLPKAQHAMMRAITMRPGRASREAIVLAIKTLDARSVPMSGALPPVSRPRG